MKLRTLGYPSLEDLYICAILISWQGDALLKMLRALV
jgi:hypothetical protein